MGRISPPPLLTTCPTPPATEACCELCGLYFENRKALASHARAHLRQFGVTEWCVNGSPIETLSEWIRHRPQKAGAYRSYIQGGRPFTKKFRNSSHARDHDGARRMPLSLQHGGMALLSKGLAAELAHGEPCKILDGTGERPMVTSPLSLVKMEEHQRTNFHSELGEEGAAVGIRFASGSGWDLVPLRRGSPGSGNHWDVVPLGVGAVGIPFPWEVDAAGTWIREEWQPPFGSCCSEAAVLCYVTQRHGNVPPSPPHASFPSRCSPPPEFERRQARPLDPALHREEEGADFQQKMEETRQPPPRMRPVPSLVPRPPQTSLVKFVGNIYTLKCR